MLRNWMLGLFVALTLGFLGLGMSSRTASAEVIENGRYTSGRLLVNPCNGLVIRLSGEYHQVWYTTPDGSTVMRFTVHYKGTDTAGTEYVFNARRDMEHASWPTMFPFSDELVYNVISKGGGQNFKMVTTVEYADGTTLPVPYITETTCGG